MMTVVAYSPERRKDWNAFVVLSKNATFLFDRDYMDYHADRFVDASLMVFDRRGRLFALFPANRVGEHVFSHQGLTYGGLVIDRQATAVNVCEAMKAVNGFLCSQGVTMVTYKAVPYIYDTLPADEPLYALTEVCHARLINRDIASVVCLTDRLPFAELRRRGQKKAQRSGVTIAYSDDLTAFWHILTDNLQAKYGAHPVHTLDEILLLHQRFPDNIRLLAAFHDGRMVAGTLLYVTPRVVKTQYISASPEGKAVGALDLLFAMLLSPQSSLLSPPTSHLSPLFIDLGTSALDHSTELRQPLIFQKEGFGARAVCYDTYEWTL